MEKFKKHIILLLSLSMTIFSFSGFTPSLTENVYADGKDVNVNFWDNGFYFEVGGRVVTVSDGYKLVGVSENGRVNQYYFSEKFNLQNNKLRLTDHQYNLLVNYTENSNARRVRVGTAINRITNNQYVSVYSNENLTGPLINIPVWSEIKVINSVLDGKLKVLTSRGEGFIDARYVRILDDTMPPNVREFNIDTPYVITVNQKNMTLKVYLKGRNGVYNLLKDTQVTTGAVGEPTPNGLFKVTGHRGTWFNSGSPGSGAKYFVQFRGNYLFHSVLFSSKDTVNQLALKKLGQKASDGCIRIPVETAKWVYDYVPTGSIVIIDNGDTNLNEVVKSKNI